MEKIFILGCFVFGILSCADGARKHLRAQNTFRGGFYTLWALLGLVLSIIYAFMELPLWGAILWTLPWVISILLGAVEIVKNKKQAK